jgi:hypothetical protein
MDLYVAWVKKHAGWSSVVKFCDRTLGAQLRLKKSDHSWFI